MVPLKDPIRAKSYRRFLAFPAIPRDWQMAVVCAIAALFLYLGLFRWPLVPFWSWGDQSIFLLHAERMLHGEVLYRDLFQFNMPGTECLFYILFRIFGVRLVIAPLTILVAGVVTTGLIFSLSRKVVPGIAAMLPPLLYLVLPLGNRLDATHHTFSMPLTLLAVKLVADRLSVTRLASASVLLGIAGVFTSTRGVFVVAAFTIYLITEFADAHEFAKRLTALLLPFTTITAGVLGYLVHRVGAKILYQSLLVFPLRYYGMDRTNNGFFAPWNEIKDAFPLSIHSLPLIPILSCAAVPFLILAFVAGPLRKHWAELQETQFGKTLTLYAFVGSAAVLSVANSMNSLRLTCAFPFGAILALWMVWKRMSDLQVRQWVLLTLLFGAFCLTLNHVRKVNRVDTPRGPVVMYRVSAEPYAWVVRRAHPGDYWFGDPDVNYIAGLPNPTPLPGVSNNGYTRPEQVKKVLEGLERYHARFVELNESYRAPGGDQNSL
ncbi:MAG TPA: hypothetical protein VF786_06460, partial [Terriglobales bacterium]